MRIVIVNTLYPPLVVGGAEKSVSLLAEALVRSGDEVSVITLHQASQTKIEERNGVRVYRVPLHNFYWPFHRKKAAGFAAKLLWQLREIWNRSAAREVGRILDVELPDVVHTNNISGFSVAIFSEVKRRKIRLVHTLRDYYMLCARYTLYRNGRNCDSRCAGCRALTVNHRRLSRTADAVVANSGYVLSKHRELGCFRGVPGSVIFNIASTDKATTRPDRTQNAQRELRDGSEASLVFSFIGKVSAEKGIEVLLAATKMLADARWRLRIAGGGSTAYIADLKRQFPDPRIEWLGFVDGASFYSSIDVSVVPSVWAEPLPRTLIEAFSAGKSAICARSGGILEIAPLGKVVETYEAADSRALARVMEEALADPDRWRSGGWRDGAAMDRFSEQEITRLYHEVYAAERRETADPAISVRAGRQAP